MSDSKTEEEYRRSSSVKKLLSITNSINSMLESLEHLESMMKLDRDDPEEGKIYQAHWNTFVVSYSRPFGKNNLLSTEKAKGLTDSERELHNRICIKYRNQHIGHTDMNNDLNKIIFEIAYGEIVACPQRHHPNKEEIEECYSLTKRFHDEIFHEEFKKVANTFTEIIDFQHGFYTLDIKAEVGKEWIKIG